MMTDMAARVTPTIRPPIFLLVVSEPDTFEPTLCYIALINNHQEQEQEHCFVDSR